MKTVVVLTMVVLLSACNTVKGIGNDISGVAEWTQDKMTKPSIDLKR